MLELNEEEDQKEPPFLPAPLFFQNYEILGEIARGGMGIVYKARQTGLNRLVALKIIRGSAFASPEMIKRFKVEAELAASLDHPNIVPIYEIAEADSQPFFSMALVEGGSLKEKIEGHPLPARESASLLAKIARTVQFAHDRGILHRDIKPNNILLDAEGEPHLTDFGLAKLMDDETDLTKTFSVLGTPSYMSPEQARGELKRLTVATDVYSLGAILFHCLTGVAPFAGESSIEIIRKVQDIPVPPPSKSNPSVSRDLDVICMKALEKSPQERYPSALAFAEDLEAFLRNEPIKARAAGPLERVTKWTQRRPAIALLLLCLLLALFGGVTGVLWQWGKANEQKHLAQAQREHTREELYAADMFLASVAHKEGNIGLAKVLLDKHVPTGTEPDLRGFEWRYLYGQIQDSQAITIKAPLGHAPGLEFSPDGKIIIFLDARRNSCRFWNLETRTEVSGFNAAETLTHLTLSPDGKMIATADQTGLVQLRHMDSPHYSQAWEWRGTFIRTLAFSPDSQLLAVGTGEREQGMWTDGYISLLRTSDGSLQKNLTQSGGAGVAFSKDGKWIVSGMHNGSIYLWRTDKLSLVSAFSVPERGYLGLEALAFLPDGRRVVAGTEAGFLHLLAVREDRDPSLVHLRTIKAHPSKIVKVKATKAGDYVVTGSTDQTIKVWNLGHPNPLVETIQAHENQIESIALSPATNLIASASRGTLKIQSYGNRESALWDVKDHFKLWNVPTAVYSPDGIWVAMQSENLQPELYIPTLWNLQTGERLIGTNYYFNRIVGFIPGSSTLLLHDGKEPHKYGHLMVSWDYANHTHTNVMISTNRGHFAYPPDGKFLVYAELQGDVGIYSIPELKLTHRTKSFQPPWEVRFAAISRDNKFLALTGSGSHTLVLSLPDLTLKKTLVGLGDTAHVVAFAHKTNLLAVGSGSGGLIELWNYHSGEKVATLHGHKFPVTSLSFSMDDRTLASGDQYFTMKLWHVRARREMFSSDGEAFAVEFSPTGDSLIAVGPAGKGRQMVKRAPDFDSIKQHTNTWLSLH